MSSTEIVKSELDQSLEYPSHYPKLIEELERVKKSLTLLDGLHRLNLHKNLLALCGVARELIEKPIRWKDFVERGWKGKRPPNADDSAKALYHVLRWVSDDTLGAKQRASFYFRALGPLLEQGLSQKKIKRVLKQKSLRQLADENATPRRATGKKKMVIFGARKRGKVWHLPAKLRFDHEPQDLVGFNGDRYFTMSGRFKSVGDGCEITAFSINLSDQRYD